MNETIELPGQPLTAAHREYLHGAGLTDEYLDREDTLIRSVTGQFDLDTMQGQPFAYVTDFEEVSARGILFGWRDLQGTVRWQLRLDEPGELPKYLAEKEWAPTYGVRADAGDDAPILIVEGTKQSHATACAVGETHTVIGVPGCTAWSTGGWIVAPELRRLVTRCEVYILLDADAGENRLVYDAGVWLKQSLGPLAKTRFLVCPGGAKEGIDDYLATLDVEDRADAIEALISESAAKPATRRPDKQKHVPDAQDVARRRAAIAEKACDGLDLDNLDVDENTGLPKIQGEPLDGSVWFDAGSGQFQPETLARYILGSTTPVALAAGDELLAVYGNGYYHTERLAFDSVVGRYLGDRLTQTHVANVRLQAIRLCQELNRRLPDRTPYKGFVNLRDGMLDLSTLTLHPHSPKYMSLRQLPVRWNPDATCPKYEQWLTDRVGDFQVGVIEESISQFLDEGRTPSKALFVFGPNRTGKSTVLRLAKEMVGGDTKVSGVSLQQLSGEGFAAAEVFGKPINMCPDMPSDYVPDLSIFKRVTGDDTITASKKYGVMLTFRANSLFLMSGNTLPTVAASEGTSYLSRVVPAAFLKSYLGFENPNIEDELLEELPGILVRWAKARQAHIAREFKWMPVHPSIKAHFAAESDRVARFVSACCVVGVKTATKVAKEAATGTDTAAVRRFGPTVVSINLQTWPSFPAPATKTHLFDAFQAWTTDEKGKGMSKSLFFRCLAQIPGARMDRKDAGGKDVTNVAVRPQAEWSSGDSAISLREILFPGWAPPGAEPTEPKEPSEVAVAENVTPMDARRKKYVGEARSKYWK
ncbi:DNA primase family protein [Mycobacteroides abscessus]|uniref:DNA primase family protein n=1 Tax=Mycobacteroides abscessus TaxID=36809 RepID=UPI00092BF23A|nr:phage/plasmid primase, P4 family [Mycobacteroides abscessus]SHT48577.1 phage/plasmid primase, P4 family, C-terminal domain [Mycobacteroides abscessus subsp. abscessus]SHT61470.1 phage/plasmid primase, P4 family, C-terminal domain [Mycobacteroides abscessus subsp. abscessus]SKK64034.1 phage/plasmid primase, P4 family, C-terminal domain [Mycobacteroides abscessus subsp. abscessus]